MTCSFFECDQGTIKLRADVEEKKARLQPGQSLAPEEILTKKQYNHHLRYHSMTPVVLHHASLDVSVKFERRPDQDMAFVCVCGKRILGRDNLKDHYKKMCNTTNLKTQPVGTSYVRRDEEEEEEEKDGVASVVTDATSSMPDTTKAFFEVLRKLNEYERDRKEDRRALLEELKAMERRLCSCISDALSRYDPSVTVEERAVVAPVGEDDVAGDSVIAGKRKRQPPSTKNSTRKALRK